MSSVKQMLLQAAGIFFLTVVLAGTSNYIRSDGLPLLHAAKSVVNVDDGTTEIDIKDAALLYMSGRAAFVDARMDFEYEEGHIAGACNLPMDEFEYQYQKALPKLQGKEVVITYCDGSCKLGHHLAEKLRAKGLPNVKVLVNGWSLWRNENLPTASGMDL